ncbi:helix-turn-helix transcriptional regulator [Paenibacillus sp. sptzw28]|uniref:helix-turn-helix domain-containing protein n=1 Tax=Paenibacillus sp. sptzw28 TaxID=715179 RepID=UPI001C6E2600|nr:helix-turn-helix transcriptional regulator [Paenibacillus sp. sptzw28]QYR20229.1 helix-turn-helix transcriptional regulator [Paenibacillus sp. sptzw28]
MSAIRSNLKEVMENHDPGLSIRKLAKDVNYHFDSIRRMYKDEMVQYPRDLLLKLCIYFKVQPGQLIVIDEIERSECTTYESNEHQGDKNDS